MRGLPVGQVQNFSLLLGILLSDVDADNSGNLTVFPGSHHLLEKFFRQTGNVDKYLESSAFEALTNVVGTLNADPAFPPPFQIKAKAGDIILAHYELPHAVAPNVSPNVRYCVYFRLHHHTHQVDTPRHETLSNIWLEFDGVRDLLRS